MSWSQKKMSRDLLLRPTKETDKKRGPKPKLYIHEPTPHKWKSFDKTGYVEGCSGCAEMKRDEDNTLNGA